MNVKELKQSYRGVTLQKTFYENKDNRKLFEWFNIQLVFNTENIYTAKFILLDLHEKLSHFNHNCVCSA